MRPTQHPSNNDVLRAPKGESVDRVRPLAITRVKYSDGTPAVASYWEPSPAERAAIAAGALIQLCVIGVTLPPVLICVDGVGD